MRWSCRVRPSATSRPSGCCLSLDEIPDIPLDPEILSRDPAVGEAYAADPLVWHGPFKRPTVQGFADTIGAITADGALGDLPLLWVHGEDDQLVPMEGTRAGIELLGGDEFEQHTYPGARHEVFNETNGDEVIADVIDFIERVLRAEAGHVTASRAHRAWPIRIRGASVDMSVWDAPDDALLAGVAAGDRTAAAVFVRRFQRRVFGLAITIVRDDGWAEEVAQDAFVRAWHNAASFDPRGVR